MHQGSSSKGTDSLFPVIMVDAFGRLVDEQALSGTLFSYSISFRSLFLIPSPLRKIFEELQGNIFQGGVKC